MKRWVIRIKIIKLIWLNNIVVKIQKKHNVTLTEVEEFFQNKPKFRRGPQGNHIKENIYYGFGRSNANRLLFVVFVFKKNNEALILSARDMDNKEKSVYSKL